MISGCQDLAELKNLDRMNKICKMVVTAIFEELSNLRHWV